MNLTDQLSERKATFSAQAPEAVQAEMLKAQQQLMESKVAQEAIAEGESFPAFTLTNSDGNLVSLEKLMEGRKHLIISFYRGGWCPYCNIELKALQNNLETFQSLGADLVAITPERPDFSKETASNNGVSFEVLTDDGSQLATQINLTFPLPESLKPIYEGFGIDVKKHNGDFNLPVPATYVINSDLKVVYRYVDVDYTKRLDPLKIIEFLK